MRFFFLVDTTLKARRDDYGRVISVHSRKFDAEIERSKPENKAIVEDLQVFEADYSQLDENHFLKANSKVVRTQAEEPVEKKTTPNPQSSSNDPIQQPKNKPDGCFLVTSKRKNAKVHAVVDHLIHLGNGIRLTNSMLCTGNKFDENQFYRCEGYQYATCPRCLALLHYCRVPN